MPSASLFSAPDLARLPIVVNMRAISLSEGLRAGLSVAAIIARLAEPGQRAGRRVGGIGRKARDMGRGQVESRG